jgi:hypothetical protein
MDLSPLLRRRAAHQHGLITREQFLASGRGRDAWYRAHRRDDLIGLAPGVAALPGAPATPERAILVGVLAAGEGALASHRSGAYLWGAEIGSGGPVDVTTPNRNRRVVLPGLRLHTPTDLDDLRPVRRRGIPTTNPLRVLLDLGQVEPGAVSGALERFMVGGWVTRRSVAAALQRHARPGRHGVRTLRDAYDAWAIDDKPPDSALELAMVRLLSRFGLPPAVFHPIVLGRELDFAYFRERVVIECDGWEGHGLDRQRFECDRARDAALVASGWVVLRFTWRQITHRPARVAEAIRVTLLERSRGAA